MRLVYGGGVLGLDLGYDISCVLGRECDVGAWVLFCRPRFVWFTSMILDIICICIH